MISPTPQLDIPIADLHPAIDTFREDFIAGLRRRPRQIAPKYFYDAQGSRLFDRICTLEEYFPTRTEIGILRERAREIRKAVGPRRRIIEFGSGSGIKTRLLLNSLEEPILYIPIEISLSCLRDAAERFARDFPAVEIRPVCADYTQPFTLPPSGRDFEGTLIFFPGSTIGNMMPNEASAFLRRARSSCGDNCSLLIGVALQADPELLQRAYDDERGVTAAFNRNLLRRAQRELGAQLEPDAFRHRADYNEEAGRIEMRLVSAASQAIELDGESFHFAPGDSIITEYSHKFRVEDFAALAEEAGFEQRQVWVDDQQLFSVQYFESRSR